jgi:hypothetical protein
MMELQYGPSPTMGSYFASREELLAGWQQARDRLLEQSNPGRRPAAFYELEWDGPRPAYAVERSVLWRTPGVLSAAERAEVEAEWKTAFVEARAMGARERREHLSHHDVPNELATAWEAERKTRPRRRRGRQPAPSEEAAAVK